MSILFWVNLFVDFRYLLMRACWSSSSKGRSSFTLLVKELAKILTKTTNVEYLNLNSPESENSQVPKSYGYQEIEVLKKKLHF